MSLHACKIEDFLSIPTIALELLLYQNIDFEKDALTNFSNTKQPLPILKIQLSFLVVDFFQFFFIVLLVV